VGGACRPVVSPRALVALALFALLSFGGSFDCRGSVGDNDDDDTRVIVTSPKTVDD